MNQAELLQNIEGTFKECLAICKKKNADYSSDDDAFANLRAPQSIGITPTKAILVRVLDKLTRLANLDTKDPKVTDESRKDTARDIAVYMALYIALLK